MRFLTLTLLYCMMSAFSLNPALEYQPSAPAKVLKPIAASPIATNYVEPGATNILLQSKDGGQTWQDISADLPEHDQPEDFFAGESDLYVRFNKVLYHSKSNLKTPVWEKEKGLDLQSNEIAFNRSGVMAFNFQGQVYQKISATGNWLPMYTNFNNQSIRTIMETADGIVFIGCDNGLYKSVDKGKNWRQVQNGGLVMGIVESEGVLIGTSQRGIMRSTDKGEHWELVISEGGVGIAVERIEGGFAAISYSTRAQSRRIRISLDGGKTWKAIDEGLKSSMSISSIKQIGGYLICGHSDGIFRSSDLGKTWSIVQPNVGIEFILNGNAGNSGNVFKLYVSGNILYAVASSAGC